MRDHQATVFVVDDDEAVRDAVQGLIQSVGLAVETFGSANEFLRKYDPARPGCLVLDVRLPGMSGLALQEKLAADKIEIPIIFITGHGDVPMAVHAIKSGALQFVQKPFRDQELLDHVAEALALDRRSRQERAERTAIERRIATLTPRERNVLQLVVDGHINKEIAAKLGIHERTVETHRAHIMDKMDAQTVVELVRMALVAAGHPVNPQPPT
jgi:FixJ family two-component response regulator